MKDIERFVSAQEHSYAIALNEIKNGKKRSHWIWYIFPQLQFLGHSRRSRYYGIEDEEEAKAYLNHPILAQRLREITKALLLLPHNLTAKEILGSIDATKVHSSMTLFYYISGESLFADVINRYYHGEIDYDTWYYLNKKLDTLRQLYLENNDRCNNIIESLGYYEAIRTSSPKDIPLCFIMNGDWYLLDGFGFHEDYFFAYILDLRTGPPDCGEVDAVALPDTIVEKTLSILKSRI